MKRTIFLFIIVILLFTGCAHKHEFSEATCTEPKTCIKCGETEGEALGHTTEIGKCDRCEEVFGKDILESIRTCINKAGSKTTLAVNYLNSATTLYEGIKTGYSYFEDAKSEYQNAIDMCADYEEFSELKSKLNIALAKYPTAIPKNNDNEIDAYLDKLNGLVFAQADCEIEAIYVAELFE